MPVEYIAPQVLVPLLLVLGAALSYLYRGRLMQLARWMGFIHE